METSFGPVSSQHLPDRPFLPDGDSILCQGIGPPGGLGDIHRSLGCLLSYSHSSSRSEVAPFRVEGQGFPVSSPPFWSGPCSLDFYQGGQGAVHLSASEGRTSQGLSGRLADPGFLSRSLSQAHPVRTGVVHETGFPSQRRQIGSLPSPAIHLSGHSFRHGLVRPADHHVTRLSLCISQLLHCPSAPAGLLATLLGLMESLTPLIPYGRLRKRALQRAFRARWSQSHQPGDALIPLGPWFLQAIAHWLDLSWVSQGVPISVPPPREELFTDASNRGWGAHMGPLSAAGLWSEVRSSGHINQLELEAVLLALQQFLPSAQGCHILLNTDNTTVACYINRQGGACSPTLSKRAEHLLWCSQHSIILTAKHIPGKLNVLADSLSRSHMILHTEWTLDSAVLAPVWDAWFCPLVDLFATRFSHKLPTFVSPVPDPAAWWWMPSLFHGRVFWPSPFLRSPFCRRFSGRPGKSKPHSSSLPRGGRLNPGSRSCCVSPMNLLSSSTFIPGPFSSPGQESLTPILAFSTFMPGCCAALAVFIRGFAGHGGHGLPGPPFGHSRGLLLPTGPAGFAGPRSTRWTPTTPLIFRLLISWRSSPQTFLSQRLLSRSIVQPFALLSANLVVHPCLMTPSFGT